MQPVIDLKKVTKRYGKSRGISDLSLTVEKGQIFGFLGPNGAGKTTTISLMVDLIRPTKGTISIFGIDSVADAQAIHRRIGFLAGDFALDRSLTGWQQLLFLGNLRGGVDKRRIKELAKRLDCNLNRQIHTLSRGNKQKVGLISALMHDPELLVFDEPTTGLDPLIQAEFNKIIYEHQQAGKTAFISSHLLSEVQEHCDQVAFIRDGLLVAKKSMREIAASSPKRVRILSPPPELIKRLEHLKGVTKVPTGPHSLEFTYSGNVNSLVEMLSQYKLQDLSIQETDLESVFMAYYSGEKHA